MPIFRQILVEYWQVLCFRRLPQETPKSLLMLMIAIGLVFLALTLEYYIAQSMQVTHLSLGVLFFSLLIQLGFIAIYTRIVLWLHQSLEYFLPFMTCWVMMMFFLDLMSSAAMGLIMAMQSLGLTKIFFISIAKFGAILGIMLSLWQVTFVVYLLMRFLKLPFWKGFLLYLGWLLMNYMYLLVLKTI